MSIPEVYISRYVLVFGAVLILLGIVEIARPRKAFLFWKKWAAHRLFFLHGIFLMAAGFPLVMHNGRFETAVFLIGLFVVFSGPFILLFPEKFRNTFESAEEELGEDSAGKIIYFEAIMRIVAGLICLGSFF